MEPLRMLQHIQCQHNRLTPQLSLNPLQRPLHAQPEVDFLGGGPGGDVSVEFGDGLDLFDPGVYVGLKLIQEGGVC